MCLAIPARVVAVVDAVERLAEVDLAGVRRRVHVGLVDGERDTAPGDWVLVHVGFAISRIDEAEAEATLELLRQMGSAIEDELAEMEASEGG